MPGILPMKVIKVGTSAQSRIAQACDRCRSKKIRCDGITPCCSQCSNVGFECKTSDKLSRRAFPRGYTESLEERVRALESEVKELKDLLDEKDEKIDILSRIHPSSRRTSTAAAPPAVTDLQPVAVAQEPQRDTFKVQQSPCLLDAGNADSYFMGGSSGRSFIDAFKGKVQESGKPCADFQTETLFGTGQNAYTLLKTPQRRGTSSKAPPRLVSDQLINIFFQEWAPLFPVLHRPTFLSIYANFVATPEVVKDQHIIVQLNLVFGIATLSAEGSRQWIASFESQWQTALEAILFEQTLTTLQCFVLAEMYCIAKADYNKLLHYRAMATSLSHRLGIHQSQRRFSLGALTAETRKKVFWTLYTLDCFSAALLGLPKLLKDCDIYTEYPADVDDENVSERGFQSALPGESTRLSSALSLFRAARIMSKVLDVIYPAASSHDLSLHQISGLSDELDSWQNSLPAHLRLDYVQDKPSTNVVGSRSPLLSLTYYYVRTLIHRPVVGSSTASKAASSVVALASSSKHIIQIIRLLEERRMSFAFCLNKNEVLLLAGFGLLYQGLELDRGGKLIQDSQRLISSVIEILDRSGAPGAVDFKRLACAVISVGRYTKGAKAFEDKSEPRRMSEGSMPAPNTTSRSPRRQIQAFASRIASATLPLPVKRENIRGRRCTVQDVVTKRNAAKYARSGSQNSISSAASELTHQHLQNKGTARKASHHTPAFETPNLDYLSFPNEQNPSISHAPRSTTLGAIEPKRLMGSSSTQQAPFNSLLSSQDVLSAPISTSPSSATHDWASDCWMVPQARNGPASAQSVLSFSEEDFTSGEELSICDPIGEFPGIAMPNIESLDGFDDLDGNLIL